TQTGFSNDEARCRGLRSRRNQPSRSSSCAPGGLAPRLHEHRESLYGHAQFGVSRLMPEPVASGKGFRSRWFREKEERKDGETECVEADASGTDARRSRGTACRPSA